MSNQQTMANGGVGNDRSLGDAATLLRQGYGGQASDCSLGRIDQYELLRELGGGGFGTVYLARDTVAGVDVAVKGLPPLVKNNAEELERIRENFALVSKLHHPNISAALVLHPAREVSYADEKTRQALRVMSGDTLMVMSYAPGVTLNKWRKQFSEGKVPVDQALEVCRQIAAALDYAHGEKVVHRDVKPSNVMIESRSQNSDDRIQKGTLNAERSTLNAQVVVRILDFGLAAEIRSSMSRVSQEKGDTSGTRPYMAPEQWAGKRQDGRTDQYALAALFYELVSGAVPFASAFDTGDPVIMQSAVLNLKSEPLAELSKAQNAVLLRGLAKEPSQRFASCGDFVASIGGRARAGRSLGEGGFPRAAAGEKPRISRIALIGLAAVVLIAASTLSIRSIQSRNARLAAERAVVSQAARLEAEKQAEAAKRDADRLVAEKDAAARAALAKEQERQRETERLAAEKRDAEERAKQAEVALAAEKARQQEADRKREFERLAAEKRDAEERVKQTEAALVAEQARQREAARLAAEHTNRAVVVRREVAAVKSGGPVDGEPWTSPSTGMEFVWIPVLKLWVGKYEVTNGEYRKKEPSHDSKDYEGHKLNENRQPVVYVNFDDAKAYAEWLTEQDRGDQDKLKGRRYRVISENEWQTCAQCGDGREYPWGNAMPPKYGNYADSAAKREFTDWPFINGYTDGYAVACPVEKSGANEWGIYGLGGNVCEVCASNVSSSDASFSAWRGTSNVSFGAWHGASWRSNSSDTLQCTWRFGNGGLSRDGYSGFRLVLSR